MKSGKSIDHPDAVFPDVAGPATRLSGTRARLSGTRSGGVSDRVVPEWICFRQTKGLHS